MRWPQGPVEVTAAVAAALMLGTAVTALAAPDPDRLAAPPSPLEPVVTTTLVCPPLLGATGTVSTQLTAWSPYGLPGQDGAGSATIREFTATGTRKLTEIEEHGGSAELVSKSKVTPPIQVLGIGSFAPGLTADLVTSSRSPAYRGLSSVACVQPGADAWFVGGASQTGRRSTLYLTSADTTPAVLDIDVYSKKGLIESPAGRGVVVPGGTTKTVELDALAPGEGMLGVRVRASSGRIASALRDGIRDGLQPKGADYVPQAVAPAKRVVVPGLIGGRGTRGLRILAPGNQDATVKITVIGRDEAFAPTGADVVVVPASSVLTVDLTKAIAGSDVSLVLESDQPITAAAAVTRTGGVHPEFAWTSAVDPIDLVGGVATSRYGEGWSAFLILTAPDEEVLVDLKLPVSETKYRVETIRVPAGRLRVVPVGEKGDPPVRGILLEPREGSGPLYAARVQQRDLDRGESWISTLPIRSIRVEVPVPQSLPDLSTGLGAAEN
jgi:hypothetical protein